jgi:hypothetical protein
MAANFLDGKAAGFGPFGVDGDFEVDGIRIEGAIVDLNVTYTDGKPKAEYKTSVGGGSEDIDDGTEDSDNANAKSAGIKSWSILK